MNGRTKGRCLAVIVAGAVAALRGHPAVAQTVITPQDITAIGPHVVFDFSVSPSDESLAFTVAFQDPNTPIGQILSPNLYTAPHLGTASTQITSFTDISSGAGQPAWNTFGLVGYLVHHVFPSATTGVVPGPDLVVTNGLSFTSLHVDGFSWSASQDTLVFSARDDAQKQGGATRGNGIYTMSYNGSGLTKIVDCDSGPGDGCGVPQGSPSEGIVAYDRGGDIHVVNLNGSNDHVAIQGGTAPVWSPVTGTIAFQCGNDVCAATEDGLMRVNLTNGLSGLSFSQPSWNADESLIVLVGRASPSDDAGDLYVTSPNGATLQPITNTADANAPQWSPILPTSPDDDDPITSAPAFEIFYICTRATGTDICIITKFQTPSSGCSPTTCPGCCSGGVCITAETTAACGLQGNDCTTCPGGKTCDSLGSCSDPSVCGAANCNNGCCENNVCQELSASHCGAGGSGCSRCGANEVCNPDTGHCEAQPCGIGTCNGCCRNGKCDNSGTSNTSCGSGGINCTDCTTSGEICTTSRSCDKVPCDYAHCASGCCQNGKCMQGDGDNACGSGASGCFDCGSLGCDKNAHQCNTAGNTCVAGMCPGCCSNNSCESGSSPTACGLDAIPCQTCGSGEQCLGGACI
jgi:hypothetical protein